MAKATNLWEYYSQKGQQLPSVSERRDQFSLGGDYRGTAQQNQQLLGRLQGDQSRVLSQSAQAPPTISSMTRTRPSVSYAEYTRPTNPSDPISLIQKYFPQHEWENAIKVMQGESGGNSDAVGDNYPIRGRTIPSYGLFQIRALEGRPAPEQLLDPEANVKYAAEMQAAQGWQPWTVARNMGLSGTTPIAGKTQAFQQAVQQPTQQPTQQAQPQGMSRDDLMKRSAEILKGGKL